MNVKNKFLPVAISVAAGVISTDLCAAMLEEIIVTAQKREESISDVPISISAFTGETMSALGMQDTRDLGKLVPGFTTADSGFGNPIYTMRGVGFNDRSYTAQNNVGVYIDEINLPFAINTKGPSLDLSRAEVLKGPQGILYGRNTTGGAINYIANKPTDEFESGVKFSYGRYNLFDVEGYVSGGLSENVAGRLAVRTVQQADGDQDSRTRDEELGEKDKFALRGQLEFTPSDDLLVRLLVDAWQDQSDARAPQSLKIVAQVPPGLPFTPHPSYPHAGLGFDDPTGADWPAPGNMLPRDIAWTLDQTQVLYGLRTEWNISDNTRLIALASLLDLEIDGDKQPNGGVDYQHNDNETFMDQQTTSFELRLQGTSTNEALDWMVGANYSEDDVEHTDNQRLGSNTSLASDLLVGAIPGIQPGFQLSSRSNWDDTVDVEQRAVFANLGWHFTEDLTLTLGARYTEQDQDFYMCAFEDPESQGAPVVVGGQVVGEVTLANLLGQVKGVGNCFMLDDQFVPSDFEGSLEEDNTSYRVALDWQVSDDVMTYISFTRGYKAGGFPSISASRVYQIQPVNQEKLEAWEIGAKGDYLEGQLRANVAVFDYDYSDKQLFTKTIDPLFGPLPILDNAPKATIQGAEVELVLAPQAVEGLLLSAAAAWIDSEVDEFIGLDSRGIETDFSGRPFNFSPEFEYTLIASYEWPVNDDMVALVSMDYSWSDETYATIEQDADYFMDSYGLLGARVGFQSADERWRFMLYARNLTDEYRTVAVNNSGDVIARWADEGRTYGFTVEYDF
jgi:iron complex outermembrane recepter protein